MNANQIPIFLAFSFVLLTGAGRAMAQAPAVVDTLAVTTADTLAVTTADTLAAAAADTVSGPLSTLPVDSAAVALPDSAAAAPVEPWFAPWQPAPAVVDQSTLEWTRPEDFERALDWLEGSSVRVAGETGMDAFVDTGPLGRPAEILVDAMPSRSPADLDPAIWDRASNMIVALSSSRMRPGHSWGESSIDATLDDPLAGRTALHTYFTRTAYETFTRAVGLRTPGTTRMLRFDFQEFKTEEGYDYSLAPGVTSDPSNRGRAKQRRFRIGGKAKTTVGEIGFEFGRGRRYTRGDVMSAAAQERWTGRIALTLDRESEDASWHARLYHLDFHDDWWNEAGASWQSSDASRLGLRVERQARDGGFFGGFTAEQQAARFLPASNVASDTTYADSFTGRVGLGWRGSSGSVWVPWISIQAALAEHTKETADFGGRAGLRRSVGFLGVQVMAERIPQTPTLAETYGGLSRRLVTPVAGGYSYNETNAIWTWAPGGKMDFERQDRAEIRVDDDSGRFRWSLAYSVWNLTRGIGWEPGAVGSAQVVSGIETDLDMLEASIAWVREVQGVRTRVMARGHWLPGNLESVAGRPGGFPRGAVIARIGLDSEFFSPRNRLGVDLDADFMGEHIDDLTGPIGGVVPSATTFDTRAWLQIRNAEIFFAIDNFTNQERMEVLGTWRRFRQYRFGLTWNFYN